MAGERQTLDEMQDAVEQDGTSIGSFEHDGLFVWQNGERKHWERDLLERISKRVGAPLAKKTIPPRLNFLLLI